MPHSGCRGMCQHIAARHTGESPMQDIYARDLRNSMRRFLEERGGGLAVRLIALWRQWDEVLGPDIAALAIPLGHRKNTLVIGAEDNMAQQDLTYYSQEILERVNAFVGEEHFNRVQVDLLMGKTDLARLKAPTYEVRRWQPPEPENLGGLTEILDPESPVTRCYKKYVRFFKGRE